VFLRIHMKYIKQKLKTDIYQRHITNKKQYKMHTFALLLFTMTITTASISAAAFTSKSCSTSKGWNLHAKATLEDRVIEGELKPTNNFVLVKIAEAAEEVAGGIILTQSAKIKKTEGVVISVGPGKPHPESGILFPMPVQSGESVLYGKYDGTEIKYNGEKHMLIRDDDILVKFTGDTITLDTVEVVNDYILVQVELVGGDETSGGLLIAPTSSDSNKKPSTGKVVKVGPGRMSSDGSLMKLNIDEGDMIKFRDFAGNEVMIENEEFSVVRVEDVLAKFN